MPHFFCKLIAPRPTFPFDMNESEKVVMAERAAYWAAMCREGAVLVYGPVMDPDGPFGMACSKARTKPRSGAASTPIR